MNPSTVKERPILFSGEMVRAILDGRKTQTRRVVKPQPTIIIEGVPRGPDSKRRSGIGQMNKTILCPYGVVGDRLWVRETLREHGRFGFPLGDSPQIREIDGTRIWSYAADNVPDHTGTIVSIHMPHWASRITLEVTGVRVERLQDISEADAIAEGITGPHDVGYPAFRLPGDSKPRYAMAANAYCDLWNSINGDDAWAANPWVWVVEFKCV